jgi:AcrR family transcriptional regulator
MTWVRARSEEQIEYRVREIVDATARLFENYRFEEITFAMIAKEARFTRSNLYRYFKTKEDIFLDLLKHDLANWRMDLVRSLSKSTLSIPEFSELCVDLLLKHKRMIDLFTLLYTTLEQNASLEALTAFKQNVMEELGVTVEHLTRTLPFKSADAAAEFVMSETSLAIGMHPLMNLSPQQKQAMDTVGMTSDPEYFRGILLNSIESLLRGLTEKSE